MSKFRDYDHFAQEILRGRAGPMASAAEDIADEIYRQAEATQDSSSESMWDDPEADDE